MVLLFGSGQVAIALSAGDGSFDVQPLVTVVPGDNVTTKSLAVGDFNGDGRIDLAVTEATRGVIVVLGDDSPSMLGAPVTIDIGTGAGFIAAADLDQDSHVDLVIAKPEAATLSVLLGDGAGSFDVVGQVIQ